jgi:hypothetical protein
MDSNADQSVAAAAAARTERRQRRSYLLMWINAWPPV